VGASGSTWFGKGSQESAGLSFCVLVTISPRRAKLEGLPRGMRSANTPPPAPAAGAPPAGPWQEPDLPKLSLTSCDHQTNVISRLAASYLHESRAFTASNVANSVPTHGPDTEHAANVKPLRRAMLVGLECVVESAGPKSACSKAQVLDPCSA
jgi:hypothetical protein